MKFMASAPVSATLTVARCCLLLCLLHQSQAARILLVYPISTISDSTTFISIAEGLLAQGHSVTIVGPILPTKSQSTSICCTHPNLDQVTPIEGPLLDSDLFPDLIHNRRASRSKVQYMLTYDVGVVVNKCHEIWRHSGFRRLLRQIGRAHV